ncbi:hypothetical protein C943_02125 [Mariniradius saccharolyticus AK6]|uniref:Uncharacterized protein n=1 Tax=Mariniradius saccharolyticus AK6 TaxID=1239962 RepID=M7X1V4_9BACT|nr:hypothetical protein C943_02125 [Mariniradius saccharolyticus AK6]
MLDEKPVGNFQDSLFDIVFFAHLLLQSRKYSQSVRIQFPGLSKRSHRIIFLCVCLDKF